MTKFTVLEHLGTNASYNQTKYALLGHFLIREHMRDDSLN